MGYYEGGGFEDRRVLGCALGLKGYCQKCEEFRVQLTVLALEERAPVQGFGGAALL